MEKEVDFAAKKSSGFLGPQNSVNFAAIEKKWQKAWESKKIFEAKPEGKKFYCLEMFPYPSGEGLHMGHTRNYAIGDCIARFKRMQGFNVLYPMGYDAFGLPAENAAIKHNTDPKKWISNNIELMESQQKRLGFSYDWKRKIITCDPEYYKWEQLFFLKFLERNLAYKKESNVNWCPGCKTVLANEQVHEGTCWRCHSSVQEKKLDQWFLKITDYADELLDSLDRLDWPERVKTMQKNWIGKSEGSEIIFKVNGVNEKIKVFTTRIDTLFGCTYIALAPEHGLVDKIVVEGRRKEVREFIESIKAKTIQERTEKGKEGIFTGAFAINPANGKSIPIYLAEYVLVDYGTGAIMCVPSHDKRDYEFAQKKNLPIVKVIVPEDMHEEICFVDDGMLVNSGQFDGKKSGEARKAITEWLAERNLAFFRTNYKLKDWLISRQRYWGTPIPVIYCERCGTVPVPEKDLPVILPDFKKVKFGEGNPLETDEKFVNVKCPLCKGPGKRETDTMDTFVDSSWYFLRYCSSKDNLFNNEVEFWMPVDFYIGGIEHACMHLIYSRFFTKALNDLKYIGFREPFSRLVCQGMVTLGGSAMSKSKGNVINPLSVVEKYSADTTRMFILFTALPEKELEWNDKGVEGIFRFLNRVYNLLGEEKPKSESSDKFIESKLQKLINDVTENIETLRLNSAIINLMEFLNLLEKHRSRISDNAFIEVYEKFITLLAPFAPHLCEELWNQLENEGFISLEQWPKAEEGKIDENEEKKVEAIEKTVDDVKHIVKLTGKEPKNVYLYVIPPELNGYNDSADFLAEELGVNIEVYSVADKSKYDPQEKAGKAKPGKPAIYVE